jgi:hypothetical protein
MILKNRKKLFSFGMERWKSDSMTELIVGVFFRYYHKYCLHAGGEHPPYLYPHPFPMPRPTPRVDLQLHGAHADRVNQLLANVAGSSRSAPILDRLARPASPIVNRPPTGTFAGSHNINIDRSVFTDIAGDQINVNIGGVQQEHGILTVKYVFFTSNCISNRPIASQQATAYCGCWIFI